MNLTIQFPKPGPIHDDEIADIVRIVAEQIDNAHTFGVILHEDGDVVWRLEE